MNANPILLQKKYTRVIACFAKKAQLPLDTALDFFYRSELYPCCATVYPICTA